jgi:hypothetical protein
VVVRFTLSAPARVKLAKKTIQGRAGANTIRVKTRARRLTLRVEGLPPNRLQLRKSGRTISNSESTTA